MKIAIELSEALYRYILNETYDEHLDRRFDFMVRHAVRNGEVLNGESEGSACSKTNGDRIRQMTDEELGEELTRLIINVLHSRGIFYGKATVEQITTTILAWLKQEVNEHAGVD